MIFELLFELYLELMMFVVPKDKAKSKILKAVAVIIAFIITIGLIALFIWGYVLTFERENMRGIIPMVIAVVLSLAQIIAGLLLRDDEK